MFLYSSCMALSAWFSEAISCFSTPAGTFRSHSWFSGPISCFSVRNMLSHSCSFWFSWFKPYLAIQNMPTSLLTINSHCFNATICMFSYLLSYSCSYSISRPNRPPVLIWMLKLNNYNVVSWFSWFNTF